MAFPLFLVYEERCNNLEHIQYLICYSFVINNSSMNETSQIVDLSGLQSGQILDAIEKLLDQADFQRFTIVLKRKEKKAQNTMRTRPSKKRAETKYSCTMNNRCLSEHSYRYGMKSEEVLGGDDQSESALSRGLHLYQIGQFDEALQILKQQQQTLKQSFNQQCKSLKLYQDLMFHIANCYYRLKRYNQAIEYYTNKFQSQDLKQQGQKYNNLGSCYAHLEQSRLSLNSYGSALKIYSNFPEVDCSNLLNNLGMLYAQSKMYEIAQKYFLQSIQQRKIKSPQNAYLLYSSYLQLGNCQKYSKKYDEAISSLQLALNFAQRGFGSEQETLYQLASIYEMIEKWGQALSCYERLSQSQMKKGFLFERAAIVHRFMGHHSDYDRFIQKAFQCYKVEQDERKISEILPIIAKITRM